MGEIVIKPDRDRDEYVTWSTFTESPIAYGNRAETIEYLGGDIQPGTCPTCRQHVAQDTVPSARLNRADKWGSSDMTGFARWAQDEFIYQQRGMLSRHDLVRACALLCDGRDDEVLPLLAPFEDGEGDA